MKYRDVFECEVPANSAGGGAIAGIGVGPEGEPGVDKKKRSGRRGESEKDTR